MKPFTALLFFLFLIGCTAGDAVKIMTENAEIVVNVEKADTQEEREKGLMHRESLGKDKGILFIFDEPIQPRFWMKNTLIPLDIIFIDENSVIVDFIENMVSCKEEPCEIYASEEYAKYALEVNAGFVKEKGIEVGNKVVI